MSDCHIQHDDIDRAHTDALTCLRYYPTCYKAHLRLGQILTRKCDYEKACLEYIYSLDLYANIDSYVIKTIWPVIGIVKELCILHMDEAKTHKCPENFDKLLNTRVPTDIWAYVLYYFITEKNFPAVTYALKKISNSNVCIRKLEFDLHPLCDLNLLTNYPDISDFMKYLLICNCDYTTLSTHTGDKYIHAAVKITFATRNLIFLKCVCTIVHRNDDQDLLDSDCNTALHIATLENTYDKLKLNVIKELIGIRCSPHKKNSQNKLAIDNLIKDTKSKKCLQKYMDETEDQVKHHETVTISSTREPPANSVPVEKQQNAMRKLDKEENHTNEDKCNTCMKTFTRCQQNIGTNSIDSLKELSKLIKSKHKSTKHKDIIAKSLSLITAHLAESPDTGIPEEVLKISQKYFKKIIDDLLKGKKWLQMYKLLIEHAKFHNGDWFPGCASDIQIKMVIRCLKEENPTISSHTLSDVVYVFLKNGGNLLHVEYDSKRYVVMAVKGNHYKLLEIIICSHNVDPQYLSLFGEIPIHAALHISLYKDKGNFSIFNTCMKKYQKNPQKYPMLDPQQQDTDGNTLFHLVVKDDCNDTLLKAAKKLQEWHVPCKVSNLHGKFPHDYLKMNDPRLKVLMLAMQYDKIKQEATVNITVKEISNVQIQPCVTVKTEVKQKPVALTTSHEKEPIKTCLSKQSDQTDENNDDTSEEANVKESLLSQIERKIKCLTPVHKFGEDEGPTEDHIQKVTGRNTPTFTTDTSNAGGTQIEDELEIGRGLLEGNVWEVECTSDVWNTLRRSNRLTPLIKRKIIHIIEDLASGECTKDMRRKLITQNGKINLFESNITDGSRLIWEECIEFSPQLTNKYSSPKKQVKIYSQRIRIWDIVLEHKKIKNTVRRIEKSHTKGASCLIQKKLKFHEKRSNNTDCRLPELYVEYMDHNEESVEDISYYPPASPQDSEYNTVKFYTFSSILANNMLKPIKMKVDFPFRVTELEYEITTLPLSAPIILIGRSGTGKTTCCLYRLWYTFQYYWTNADCDDDKCSPAAVHNNLTNADCDDDKCSTDVVHNNLTNADCDDDKCSTDVVHNNLTNADCDDDKYSPAAVHNNLTNADCDDDKCSTDVVHNNLTNADCDDDKCFPEAVHNNITNADCDDNKYSSEAVHNNITNADYDDYKCSTEAVQNNCTHVDSDDHKYSPEAVHNNITNADYVDAKCSPETEPLLDDGTTNYIVTKVLRKPRLPPTGKAMEPQKKKYSSFGIGNHGVILHTPSTEDRDRKMLLKNCREYGLEFRGVTPSDGNCFFHAICDQFERLCLQRMSAKDLRTSVVGYMKEHQNYEGIDGPVFLGDFMSGPYEEFCERMSDDGVYVDHVVVESTAKKLKRDIVVIRSSHENKRTRIKGSNKPDDDETPLLVGHIPEKHYQSLQPKVGSVCREEIRSNLPRLDNLIPTITNDAEENTRQQTCLPDYQCGSSIPELSDITTSITNSYTQIMKDASVENIDIPQCRPEPTSKDFNNSTEREHHLHQIFITKNRVLCGEVQKTFREFMHADENTECHIEWENKDLPNRLQDINDYQYPLFITDRQLLLMLDASLEPPYYFDRNIDFSPKVEVEGWTNLNILQNILSLDDDLDSDYSTESESSENDEDHEEDDHRTQRKVKRTRAKKIDPRREVTYEVFKELIWPRIINKSVASKDIKKYNPSLVWTEILSFIKGSYEAISSESGYLGIDEYLEVGNKKAPTFRDVREHIYTIFLEYERLKKRKQKHNWFFDQTDFVRNIYQRLSKQNGKKWSIDQIYVDEAQDFTQAELYLLIQLCDCPNGMFLTGDTAQSIMKGISFRFKDLHSLFLHVSENKSCKSPSGISWVPDEVKSLSHNYRSHAGITSLATSVLHILIKLFPESVDKLEKDKGLFPGPKPVILESCRTSDLNSMLCNSKRETSRIEFGAHQAILVVDDNARNRIPEELKGALVLTLYEAKGLEFDDVLLYNLFKDSQDSVEWRVVTSFVKSDCREEDTNLQWNCQDQEQQETLQPSVRPRHSQFDKKRDRVVEFDEKRDRVLIAELKQLYTAITRARCNVWIFDESEVKREPMFDYFKAHDLVVTEVQRSFATRSTPQEWIERGEDLMKRELYERAAECFKTAGDDNREKIAYAYQHYQNARQKRLGSTEMNEELYQAANKFLDVKMNKEAAKCLSSAGQLELSTLIYEKGAQRKKLAEIYRKQKKPVKSSQQYERLNRYDKAIDVLLEYKMFDKAIDLLKRYQKKVQDKNEERGTDHDRRKLYHPRDNQSEEQINGIAAEYYHARGEWNLMLETLNKIPDVSYRVSFLQMRDNGAKNKYIELAANILSENGHINEAAYLSLQYGRTTEALALFRQIDDAQLIAHCLFIHARTKLGIDSDGSARYISNENEKIEIYLKEAIQLFEESNRHDNVQDLNTAMGEAHLLLGRLSGDQKYIGFAFGKFLWRKPYRNEAGQLECLNWMINHSRLENEENLHKVILGMKNMFNVISILVTPHNDPAKRNRMEQILQNFGLHLERNVTSYNPRHNPSILKLLGKEEYPAILAKQDVRGVISLESARDAIIVYLLSKGQQWHHKIVTVLEKETTCLRKSDISQIAAKDLFRLIQLDVLYGQLEYFLDEGIQSVKGHLKKDERQVLDTYKHQISSFSQCRLLIDYVLCVIPRLRDNTKQMMELKTIYSVRCFIESYFKFRLSKLMNRSNKMRYQSIAYFVELITCHRIFVLKHNINDDLAKLENTIGTECLMGETRRNNIRRMGFIPQGGRKEHVIFLSKVRPFLYSIQKLTKFNGIFGALKEFKRFICFMKGHEIQLTFLETTPLLHWLQYYIYVGFSLQSKCSHLRQIELEFIIPSTFLSNVKLVDSLIFCNSYFSTGTMIANFTSKTIPKYGEISGIIERCIEYLIGNIMKTAFKHLLECTPINETQTLLDITNEVETVMCLCMVFIINLGKIIFEKTETQILREIALINIPEDSPEKIVRIMKGIKSASGIVDIYNHLLEVLNSKGEKLLKLKWDAKQKKIAECNFISDLNNGFHLPDSIKTLADPERTPEQNVDESESEKVEFTADEITSTEEDHEKIAQVVENTEQSHAANVELIHEEAHRDESFKDTFFPECLVNESRCDICGKIFQPDTVDLGKDDGSEYLSDSEQHDTLSLPRSALAPVRSLSSTSDEIKLSKDLHISSGLHKSNQEKYDKFKKYYHLKVKSGLEDVDKFIQWYQLDSPNVTKIYDKDDFRINRFVTSVNKCKTSMAKLVKARRWTDRNIGGEIRELTKQMEALNASVKDAFHTHTQPENVETEDQIEDMKYDPNKKRKKSNLKGKQK